MKMKYAKNDFSKDNLPLNRRKQFGAIFKNEWKTLLGLGALYLIPLAIVLVLEFIKWTLYASGIASSEDGSEVESVRMFVELIYNGALIIVYLGFAILFSGTARVIQRLVYGEGLLFKGDFIYGIKHNFGQMVFYAFMFWITKMLVVFGTGFLRLQTSGISAALVGILDAVFAFVITPILFIAATYSITYKMKIGQELSNGFKTYIMTLLIPLLYAGIVFGMGYLDIYYLPKQIILIIVLQIVFVLLLLPLLILVWHLYMTSFFDKRINENVYPEIYLKGLRDYNYEGEKVDEHHDNANN